MLVFIISETTAHIIIMVLWKESQNRCEFVVLIYKFKKKKIRINKEDEIP